MKAATERKAPWATIGRNLPDDVTIEDAMSITGLDYEVGITDAIVEIPANEYESLNVPFPNKRVTYRKDTLDPLGFVGNRYHVLQHHDVIPLLEALTGTGWSPLCGGTLKGGAVGWLVGSLPYEPKSGEFEPNLAVMNSFDMSSGLRFANTPLRPSCNNAVQLMMKGAKSSFVLKHSKHMEVKFEEAREALQIAVAYAEKLDEEIERLLDIEITLPDARNLVNRIIPIHQVDALGKFGPALKNPRGEWKELSDRTIKVREEKQDDIIRHWLTSETIEDIRYTGWGWVNALNEMDQWTPRAKTSEQGLAERTLLTQLNAVSGTWTAMAHRSFNDMTFRAGAAK
jgi:phage/plasmid-like protein (TIGR03299 family)